MSDGTIPVQNPATTDTNLDAEFLTVSAVAVARERMQIAGAGDTEIARVQATDPDLSQMGLVVRQAGHGNAEDTAVVSGSYTTDQQTIDLENLDSPGIAVILDVTSPGTGDITLHIQGKDPASGKYVDLLVGASVTSTTTLVYRCHPAIPAVANATAQEALWRTWRILVVANNANAVTYSVGYTFLS